MKKLFSSLLAATMVAGMSVSAFAGTKAANITNNDNDFGLIGAYTDEGGKLEQLNKNNKIDGGDKLYFPILVSGEELLDQKDGATEDGSGDKLNDNDMYFATKASEVKSLKASVKDEIGGKYIDSASIVKKDIEINSKGETAGKFDNFESFPAKLADLQTAVAGINGVTVIAGEATANADGTGKVDTTIEAKVSQADKEVVINSIKFNYAPVTGNDVVGKVAAQYDGTDLSFTISGSTDNFGSKTPYTPAEKDFVDAATSAINNYDNTAKSIVITATDITVYDGTNAPASNPTVNAKYATPTAPVAIKTVTVDYKKAEAGKKSDGTVTASYDKTKDELKFVVTGKNTIKDAGSSIGKVYCVEVKMSDYFKPEETEVEFNIKIKDGGKVAFDTDDDKLVGTGYFFNGTFDLGRDTVTLNAHSDKKKDVKGVEVKKFKKGDLEILIGKDTRSVQLDEAIESDGKTKEDITNIYIENDKTIDNTFTFDVKASSQDDLYLELNQDAIKDLVVSNSKADLIFFNFPGTPEFDFAGTATFAVEDEDADNYFYEIVDGELVESKAKYNDDDGVFELRTNKLGSYVISDKELDTAKEDEKADDTEDKANENGGGDANEAVTPGANGEKGNANTGAADLIGVASALAVVSVAAAGAVALKK